ncbi:outer membrane lipoprotein-sorting protein [Candidatus Fermentibacteria bacterium]|nr:MAG: outer membrane lipoprotein-sorting protein [Candidatus Fermentibacteria bacterium]
MKSLLLLLGLSIIPGIISDSICQPPIDELVHSLDQLYRSDDSYAEMSMHIVTPHWERTLTMKAWSLGIDKTFIRILSPAREAGMASLRIGTEMWNYLPNTSSTVRIPSSMMAGSWMGSDITNNDIVREITYADDYTYSYTTDTTLTGVQTDGVVYIELFPKSSTAVVWSGIVFAVRIEDTMPLWEKYYDSHGDLIKTVTYSDVQEMDGRIIPAQMQVIPADKEDQSTTITWSHAEFNRGLDTSIFSLSNLQSGE